MRTVAIGALAAILFATTMGGCGGRGPTEAMGTLERDRIELIAEASEPIVAVLVREGDWVEAGQPLVRLYNSRLQAQVDQAQAACDRAKGRLDELLRGPRKEAIAEARAKLAGAEGTLTFERGQLAREAALAGAGAESQERLDLQSSRYQQTLSERDADAANLLALERGTTKEELTQARAALSEAEAALAAVRIQRDRLELKASRRGQIDALPYKLGERPPAGAVLVVMLADGAPYARVYVPEPIRAGVRPGVSARIRVDGVAQDFAGRVRTVSHDAAFTPFYALTNKDRGRLAYLAEVDLLGRAARDLPTGVPVQVIFGDAKGRLADGTQ